MFALNEDAEECVRFDMLCVPRRAHGDANPTRLAIVDNGLQMQEFAGHISCAVAEVDRGVGGPVRSLGLSNSSGKLLGRADLATIHGLMITHFPNVLGEE